MIKFALGGLVLASVGVWAALNKTSVKTSSWEMKMRQDIERIDADFKGQIGVFVKRLDDQSAMNHQADRNWYLASTTKVFVAAALLEAVDQKKIRLDEKMTLRREDFVDGSGEVTWKKPGAVMTIEYLLQKMLTQSDSTATDMLIRKVGLNEVNRFIQSHARQVQPITTILRVRHDAYAEAHPQARRLTNMDFIALKKVPASKRLDLVAKKIRVPRSKFNVRTVDEAFDRYYAKGLNSASLVGFAHFLENLLTGKILSGESTTRLKTLMEAATTGEKRIKAGLPGHFVFAQKTGTQLDRMCNVGVVRNPRHENQSVVITTCIEDFEGVKDPESVFAKIGQALAQSGVLGG